jgi:hypothetical protein
LLSQIQNLTKLNKLFNNKMKISTIVFAAMAISSADAYPLLLPTASGAVLDSECLLDNFVALQYPSDEFGDSCSPPTVSQSQVLTILLAANDLCMDDFTDYLDSATSLVLQVFAAELCR